MADDFEALGKESFDDEPAAVVLQSGGCKHLPESRKATTAPGETAEQARQRARRDRGARPPLFEEPPPDTVPEDRRLAHRRIPPPKRQKRLFSSKKAAADLVFQNFLVYLYPDKLFRR